jgi:hypothetical protein
MSSMSSAAQISANRLNAAKSTGPRSSEVSALNARKHGLRSAAVPLLPSENRAEWEELLNSLRNEWSPETPTEELLVEKLASSEWRRRRADAFEVGGLVFEGAGEVNVGTAIARDCFKGQTVALAIRYRRAACSEWASAVAALERAAARKKGLEVPVPMVMDVNITADLDEQREPKE